MSAYERDHRPLMSTDGSVILRVDVPGTLERVREFRVAPGCALYVGLDPAVTQVPPLLVDRLSGLSPRELRLGYSNSGGISRLQFVLACPEHERAWIAS